MPIRESAHEKKRPATPRRRRLRAHTRGDGAWGAQAPSDAKGLVEPPCRAARAQSPGNKISGPYEQKGKRKGAYADASGGDSLTWRRRACGDAHDDSKALTLCGSWTRGAGSPQAAWYSWPFGDTNSHLPRLS